MTPSFNRSDSSLKDDSTPSLRAQRSNPADIPGENRSGFTVQGSGHGLLRSSAPHNDGEASASFAPEQPQGFPAALAMAALHEFYAAGEAHGPAMSCCALLSARTIRKGPLLWIRQPVYDARSGRPYAPGLAGLGIDPGKLILLRAGDDSAALQAGLEGARAAFSGAVLIELYGEAKAYDLTASRRLALAARASGTPVLLTRIARKVRPSAAHTRWLVCPALSRPLAATAPGFPLFHLTLLRDRGGQEGLQYHVEWDAHARNLVISPAAATLLPENSTGKKTPLSVAVVPLSPDRQDAPRKTGATHRRAG